MTAVEGRPRKVRGFLAQAAASSGIHLITLRAKLASRLTSITASQQRITPTAPNGSATVASDPKDISGRIQNGHF
jgi:hypothetical protein